MKVKVTMKIGDESHILGDEESKTFGSQQGFEQLLQAKGMLMSVFNMIDLMEPEKAGQKVEAVMEFDDGQYFVIGRKAKEINDGR